MVSEGGGREKGLELLSGLLVEPQADAVFSIPAYVQLDWTPNRCSYKMDSSSNRRTSPLAGMLTRGSGEKRWKC